MGSIVHISKSLLCGFGLYQSYRNSRVFLTGWHEQKMLCTLDAIGNLAFLTFGAQNNVKTVWGVKWAQRISHLSYASYVGVPLLHYASQSLENTEFEDLKKCTDFAYLHLTDLVMGITTIHTVAALRFGHNRIGNGFQLACIAFAYLEQGYFGWEPKQNQGPLAQWDEGRVYQMYSPFIGVLSYYLHLPIQVLFKGVMGKLFALLTLFIRYAPNDYKAACIPDEVQQAFQRRIEELRTKDVELKPLRNDYIANWIVDEELIKDMESGIQIALNQAINNIDKGEIKSYLEHYINHTLKHYFYLTERHLQLVAIEDLFPNRPLETLERQCQQLLEADQELDREQREWLRSLLGHAGQVGQLKGGVIHAETQALREERSIILKGVLGCLANNWQDLRDTLISRRDEFLCEVAGANTLKTLYFELYPSIKFRVVDDKGSYQHRGRQLQSQIALVLQQYRDYGFSAGIQEWAKELKQRVIERGKKESDTHRAHYYQQITDLSQITTKLWWRYLGRYAWKAAQSVLWNNATTFLEHMGRNRHELNIHMALYGKNLGLSDYEEACQDMRQVLKQFSLNFECIEALAETVSEFFKLTILQLHQDIWYSNVFDCIIDQSDERVQSSDVLHYIHQRVDPSDASQKKIQEEIERVISTPDSMEYKMVINKYLPQVLEDLDFLHKRSRERASKL